MTRPEDPLDRLLLPLRRTASNEPEPDPRIRLRLMRAHRTGSARDRHRRLARMAIGLAAIVAVAWLGWAVITPPTIRIRSGTSILHDGPASAARQIDYVTDAGARIRVMVTHRTTGDTRIDVARRSGSERSHDTFITGVAPEDAYPRRSPTLVTAQSPLYRWNDPFGTRRSLFILPLTATTSSVLLLTDHADGPQLIELPGAIPTPTRGSSVRLAIADFNLELTVHRTNSTTSLLWTDALGCSTQPAPGTVRLAPPEGDLEIEVIPSGR